MTFNKSTRGIIKGATGVPNEIAAPIGQPTSKISSFNPRELTMALAAGPRPLTSKLMTRLTPTNPIPMVIPARKDFLNPCLKIIPNNVIIIGSIIVGPKSKMKSTACLIIHPPPDFK
ncbi:hypothetical protein C883_3405 [Bacillus stratosphericus LAMA 585]|nr:hypothetical protein C883_3405 [Bacillus stratosphericus LAMA 585]